MLIVQRRRAPGTRKTCRCSSSGFCREYAVISEHAIYIGDVNQLVPERSSPNFLIRFPVMAVILGRIYFILSSLRLLYMLYKKDLEKRQLMVLIAWLTIPLRHAGCGRMVATNVVASAPGYPGDMLPTSAAILNWM